MSPTARDFGALAGLFLFAYPLLVLALARAGRILPRRARADDRWPLAEAVLVFVTPFALGFLLAALLGREAGAPQPSGLTQLVAGQALLAGAAALVLALAARRPAGLAGLGLAASAPRGALASVLLAYVPGFLSVLPLAVLWGLLCERVGWDTQQDVMTHILALEGGQLVLGALIAVLIGPWIEELLFRGFLLGFLESFLHARVALVTSALLFAALHGLAAFAVILPLSLFLGWLQQRTRSLVVPWFAHALNNAVALSIAFHAPRP
jgi:membrane protease YdiL (CAAX protease family)